MRRGLIFRMIAASSVLAILISIVFAVLLSTVSAQRYDASRSRQAQEFLATSNRLERLVVDVETGERGYLLTRQTRFLQPWEEAQKEIPQLSQHLVDLAIRPEQNRRALKIQSEANSYVFAYSVPVIDSAKRGDPSATSAATTEEGRIRIDALRTTFNQAAATARARGVMREARSHQAARTATIVGVAGATGSVLLIVVFAGYLTKAIVRPVRSASVMAGRLAGGDLATRMPETGVGEIGTLEREFNTMGRSLEQSRDQLGRLAEEQAALRRVATLVAHSVAPSTVFATVAEEVGTLLGVDGTRMLRYEPDGGATVIAAWGAPGSDVPMGTKVPVAEDDVAGLVLRDGRTSRMDNLAGGSGVLAQDLERLGVRSAIGSPIVVEGRVWGVMTALSAEDEPLPADSEARFADFTDLVATAIANTQARADLIASRARVVTATDQTRRQIERDLHDGIQQRLVSLTLDLRTVEAGVPDELGELRDELSEVANGLSGALDDVREVSRGIHPAILSEAGLAAALRALRRRSKIPVELDVQLKGRLPQQIEVAAYYVVSEALTNATKHAQADVVRVSAAVRDSRLCLTIADDGVGGADPKHGTGLLGLIDRVEALGGTLDVSSPPDQGTTMRIELPVQDA